MTIEKVGKITISLPRALLELADRLAQEWSMSRSGVIAELLMKEQEAGVRSLMAEGYQEMAEENRRLAEDAFSLASEMIEGNTAWGEETDG